MNKTTKPILTIWVNYYNEPDQLQRWFRAIDDINEADLSIRVHIIDDGSQQYPAFDQPFVRSPPSNFSLYRVKKDLGFNSHGCRNLAMKITNTDWNILCDIDRGIPIPSLQYVVNKIKDMPESMRGGYYVFRRTDKLSTYALHDYLIHKDDFWKTGGYDEEYTGIHHGDRIFIENLEQFVQRRLLLNCSIDFLRVGRTLVQDDKLDIPVYDNEKMVMYHPTKNPKAGTPEQIRQIIEERNKKKDFSNKKVIQFEWEQLI